MDAFGSRKIRALLPAMAAGFALLHAAQADAQGLVRLDLIPSLRLEEVWRSNVTSTDGNEVSSFGTRVIPGFGVRFTGAEEVTVTVRGTYEKMWYHDADAENQDYDTWNIRVDSTGEWRFTPRFSVRPSVFFLTTEDSYRRVQQVPVSDEVLEPVSIINYGKVKTQDFGAALNFRYLVSPKWTMTGKGQFTQERFPEDNTAEGLTNNSQVGGDIGFSYAVSPISSVGMTVGMKYFEFEDDPDSEVYSAVLTYQRQFSPVLRFNLNAGASHARREDRATGENESDTTPVGSMRLTYLSDAFTANVFATASYSGSSGAREATRQYTGGITLSKRLTQKVTGTLGGQYQVHKSAYSDDAVDVRTIYGHAGLDYRPWEFVSLYLNGGASHQESEGQFGDTIENYSANLGFSISNVFPIF